MYPFLQKKTLLPQGFVAFRFFTMCQTRAGRFVRRAKMHLRRGFGLR
jgi:hypothetical protein